MTLRPDEPDAAPPAPDVAALLPMGDPLREAAEVAAARGSPEDQARWLAALEEAATLRLALREVRPPADLEARLLALPGQHWPLRARGLAASSRWRMALAAAGVLLVVGVLALLGRGREAGHGSAADAAAARWMKVAQLAAEDHLGTHALEVLGSDADHVARELAADLQMDVVLPAWGPVARLEGGRRCSLGGAPVAFTRWQGASGALTLVTGRAADLDLSPDRPLERLGAKVTTPDGAVTWPVLVHADGGTFWMVVADVEADLERVLRAWRRPPDAPAGDAR